MDPGPAGTDLTGWTLRLKRLFLHEFTFGRIAPDRSALISCWETLAHSAIGTLYHRLSSSLRRRCPPAWDGEIVLKLVNVIKANAPNADQRDPEAVPDEILSECAKALQAKYGTAQAA
jgi:hypothetical protein